jgi:hypothetical protein
MNAADRSSAQEFKADLPARYKSTAFLVTSSHKSTLFILFCSSKFAKLRRGLSKRPSSIPLKLCELGLKDTGEGGIRTLGTLLRYSALAKRRFRPLSHLTWICGGTLYPRNMGRQTKPLAANRHGQGVHGVRSLGARQSFGSRKGRSKIWS